MMMQTRMIPLIEAFRCMCFDSYPNDIEVISKESRRRMSGEVLQDGLPIKVPQAMESEPINNICRLAKTPRLLKAILRRTYRAWERLHGEIDLDNMIAANALRYATPEAFAFLLENYDETSSVPRFGSTETRKKRLAVITEKWDQATEAVRWDVETAKGLIEYLFPGWGKISYSGQAIQGFSNSEYWARFLAEEISPECYPDQEIIKLLRDYQDRGKDIKIRNTDLALVLCTNVEFVDRFEYLAAHFLSGQEIRQVASKLFKQALELLGVRACNNSVVGFVPLWRLATHQPIDEKEHLDWLDGEIFKALPRSLHLANDIYYYWSSNSKSDIQMESHRIEFYAQFVNRAKDLFEGKPRVFLQALDPQYMYSSFHLSVLLSSPKHGGPGFIADKWHWFASLLLDAGKINPQVIVPQIVTFLIEEGASSSGFAYSFNEVRCGELFRDERSRLMAILSTEINVEVFDLREKKKIQLAREAVASWVNKFG